MDKDTKKSVTQMFYASSVGVFMVIVIFGGLYLGRYIDHRLGTTPYFTIFLIAVGIFTGLRNVYLLIKKLNREPSFIDGLKSESHKKRPPPPEN
ncbi:MAG: AtpZ/AtpI family protein [Syntrophobacterales bacterium]|jgi:ATP synthase protein I|nr:AtpZ/AtpI family protein [Syntrophobacterales bacterium]